MKTKIVVYDPLPIIPVIDPNVELRTAIAASTTLAELKAALLGQSSAGQVAGKLVI